MDWVSFLLFHKKKQWDLHTNIDASIYISYNYGWVDQNKHKGNQNGNQFHYYAVFLIFNSIYDNVTL